GGHGAPEAHLTADSLSGQRLAVFVEVDTAVLHGAEGGLDRGVLKKPPDLTGKGASVAADARPRRPLCGRGVVDALPHEADHELRCAIEQGRSLSDIVQPLGADLELPGRVDDEAGGHVADELAANRASLNPALNDAG